MFGDVYKIKEEDIPRLAKKARSKKIATLIISFGCIFIFLGFYFYPNIEKGGSGYWVYIITPFLVIIYLSIRLRKTINPMNELRAYEVTISDNGIQCCYMVNNSIRNMSIEFSEISKISHYIKGSILIIGKDLGHSFGIPQDIEKREEIIAKLSAIKPIQNGKKEIRLYYWQRINMVFFFIGALIIFFVTSDMLLMLGCLFTLYSISLPVYFFITSRHLTSHVKLVNGVYVAMGLLLFIGGVLKIIQN